MTRRNAYLAVAMMAVIACGGPGRAEPSPPLAAALDVSVPSKSVSSHALLAVRSLLEAAGVRFNISFESLADGKYEWKKGVVPAGTLKQQLDNLASAAGYAWEANGDWLNLFPKSAANDPNYVMNKRIPGEIEVSPTPYATSIKPWAIANRISFSKVVIGIEKKVNLEKIAGNRIVLKDPTVREYYNAHATVYGVDGYSIYIRQGPDPADPTKTLTSITEANSIIWEYPRIEDTTADPGSR